MESRTGRSSLTAREPAAPPALVAVPETPAASETRAASELVPSARGIAERFRSLSRREAEVCSLVARRLSTAEIAAFLFISPRTVEKHVEMIFDKLDARSREQLRWRLGVFPNLDRDAI